MWFRKSKEQPAKDEVAAVVRIAPTNGHTPVTPAAPAPVAEAFDVPPLVRERMQAPLKSQATSTDARAERLFRKIRTEMDELRSTIDAMHEGAADLTELDLEAVAENPEAAASLPPATLVKALIEAHHREVRLRRKIDRSEQRIEQLGAKNRALKQQKAWLRGRQTTFEDVIGALHANIEDLRISRDTQQALADPAAPRVLRPATMAPPHGALPGVDQG